ncbi:MAG: ferrochelatase [Thermoguttaceae bacterium]|nr:ferrochelatase [Thermoguttaceae bacterium]
MYPARQDQLPYDAFLLVGFGGPERPEDVIPFLESVLGGRQLPPERLQELTERYMLFGGQSPLNAQNRALLTAVIEEFRAHGLPLAVYWGNRHAPPLLEEAISQMAEDGCRRALAFVTSAFGSYPGCRQYQEAIQKARSSVGPAAPEIDKLRLFFNHPGFIEAVADRVRTTFRLLGGVRSDEVEVLFTAHSLPVAMAKTSPYQEQLLEACRLVAEALSWPHWQLVYQSRSGSATEAWLQPELPQYLYQLREQQPGVRHLVFVPIGFLSDHMEVIYDLDVEVAGVCEELGLQYHRAGTVGVHPRFVRMIRELVLERLDPASPRLALGNLGPSPDECPPTCCLPLGMADRLG